MRFNLLRIFSCLFIPLSLGLPLGVADPAEAADTDTEQVSFHLTQADVIRLRTEKRTTLAVPMPRGGQATLQLAPFNLLAPQARIQTTSKQGPRALVADARFLRGSVVGNDKGWAAFVLTPRGLRGHVWLGDEMVDINPGSAGGGEQTVSRSAAPSGTTSLRCGVDDLSSDFRAPTINRAPQLGAGPRPGVRLTCDIAVDCDYEFYVADGSEADAADDVLAQFALVSTIYERDLDVTLRVSYLNVWTTPDDPYSTVGPFANDEFRDYWNANHADVERHAAVLFSGRDLGFGGIANRNTLCTDYGYCIATRLSLPVATLAHELGHVFGSWHTQSCAWQSLGLAPPGALLDSCVAGEPLGHTTDNCYTGPVGIVPAGGGTIMSYCNLVKLDFHPVTSGYMRQQAELSCIPADAFQPPRNVTASVEPTLVRLHWEPSGSPGVVRYDIYRSSTPLDPAPDLIGSSTTQDFVDGRIRVNAYYKIRAVGDTDQSGFSGEILAVALPDTPPQITVPTAWTATENAPLAVSVAVSDLELDPIETLTATPLPEGATFSVSPDRHSGTLAWTPVCFQAGEYTITFTAYSGLTSTAMLHLTIQATDCPPLVQAAPDAGVAEGQMLEMEVTASDREGDPITTFQATPLPAGATFTTSADRTQGVLRWTPGFDQSGAYDITFQASSGMTASAKTHISVSDVDRPPVLSVAPSASTIPGLRVTVPVTTSDPDGEPIAVLAASGLPAGATFLVGPDHQTAAFDWIPQPGQEGTYEVSITASNATVTTAALHLQVLASADRPPTINAPATASGAEGTPLSVDVNASDPDGDDMVSLAAGPLPDGAAFQADTPSHGTLRWTPDYDQAGSYPVILSAVSAARAVPTSSVELTGWTSLQLVIANVDRAPAVTAPANVSVSEGSPLEVLVTASDPDGDAISGLTADLSSLPLGHNALFTPDAGGTGGKLAWTPGFDASGEYDVAFAAVANGMTGSARTRIAVADANRAPVARAGGPYTGFVSLPVAFDGSASSDPDGQALTYRWQFGDGGEAVGATAAHTYVQAGQYPVVLTVSDGHLEGSETTSATVASALEANAFTAPGDRTIRLQSGKPAWCVRLEPLPGSFDPGSVDVNTVRLQYGAADIAALDKASTIGDQDRDGLPDLSICFSKGDLRTLFGSLPPGTKTVEVTIRGQLIGDGVFQAHVVVDVLTGGAAASVAPNPIVREGTLTFKTGQPGTVAVQLFDLRGRLVGTLMEPTFLSAGYHDAWIPNTVGGKPLPSGVYFYRVRTPERTITGRFTVMR